jgi:hypothetical protein
LDPKPPITGTVIVRRSSFTRMTPVLNRTRPHPGGEI